LRPLLGIGLKTASALAFTLMYVLIKQMSADYLVGETMFFRCAFGLVPLAVWLIAMGAFPASLATRNIPGHIKRSVLGSLSQLCGFSALGYLTLSETIAIGYAMPLFGVILAALMLGETVRAYRWSAVAIGFVGVIIMLAPHLAEGWAASASGSTELIGATMALVGAAMGALASVQNRRLTLTEPTGAIVFYFSVITAILSLASVPFGWKMPTPYDWLMFAGIGVLGGVGQILLTSSYRYAEISTVAPFEYTSMIWTLILGWMVFDELPDAVVATGALIVAAAGVFVIWRERRLGIETKRSASSSTPPTVG
jgi:drug/metabolite transporter (DMT)-like permease